MAAETAKLMFTCFSEKSNDVVSRPTVLSHEIVGDGKVEARAAGRSGRSW